MKREDILLTLVTINTVAIVVIGLVGYHYLQQINPELQALSATGNSLSNLWGAIKSATGTTGSTP